MNNQPLAQIESGGTIYYIHNDHLGTPQKMTDATSIVWDRTQQPFGETYAITGAPINNLRFPGQYYDSESGLNYNMMRDYNPALGRYIESDPIGLSGTSTANINVFGYANQNPVRYTDPMGNLVWVIPAIPYIQPTLVIGGALLCNAVINTVSAISNQDEVSNAPNQQPDDKSCEEQVRTDEAICRWLSTPSIRARCYESANARYGACVAGKPLLPLITQ